MSSQVRGMPPCVKVFPDRACIAAGTVIVVVHPRPWDFHAIAQVGFSARCEARAGYMRVCLCSGSMFGSGFVQCMSTMCIESCVGYLAAGCLCE